VTLGEAKRKLIQIGRRLDELSVVLSRGPRRGVDGALEECNALLRARESLERQIRETEATTFIEDAPLTSVQAALRATQQKLDYINLLINRDDLGDQRETLFEQLEKFKSLRDQLERSIDSCLWNTQILDE
jgi:hypothetical protein